MKLRCPYLFNMARVKYFIKLDKERKKMDYVYIKIAASDSLYFVSDRFSFVKMLLIILNHSLFP